MKRHKDALGIQQGARNVRAIARSLLEASEEAAREGIGAEQDAAVRMIVHQLARVCNVDEITYGFDPTTLRDVYCILMAECEERAKEMAVGSASHSSSPEQMEPLSLPVSTISRKAEQPLAVVLHERGGEGNSDAEAETEIVGEFPTRRSLGGES